MSLVEFTKEIKSVLLEKLSATKPIISGHNGPYRDRETEIRGLAHSIAFLSNMDFSNGDRVHENQVADLLDKLLNSENRIGEIIFKQRQKPGKDEVNGVIGIAWVIEGLCCAYRTYGNKKAEAFLRIVEGGLHFNNARGLWTRPVPKDSPYFKTIDETFNHQLWLAYALVFKSVVLSEPVSDNVKRFFTMMDKSFNVYPSGLIIHAIHYSNGLKGKFKRLLKSGRDWFRINLRGQTKKYKESGYHLFNMFAFARVADLGFVSLFDHSTKFRKALKYCGSKDLLNRLNENKDTQDFYRLNPSSGLPFNRYGFPYNVAGFEFLYVQKVFDFPVDTETKESYLDAQLSCYAQNFNYDQGAFLTEDKANLILRAYELSFIMIDQES